MDVFRKYSGLSVGWLSSLDVQIDAFKQFLSIELTD